MSLLQEQVYDHATFDEFVYREKFVKEPDEWQHKEQFDEARFDVVEKLSDEDYNYLGKLGIV